MGKRETSSLQLVAFGLLAALLVLIAIPVLSGSARDNATHQRGE